jgi:hypothetical protein
VSKTVEYAEGPKATKNFEEGMRALSQRLHVGANDIANTADFGVAVDSLMLAFFWRRQSFRASIATSSPILFRNLKQSAIVFAAEYTRTGTPSTL